MIENKTLISNKNIIDILLDITTTLSLSKEFSRNAVEAIKCYKSQRESEYYEAIKKQWYNSIESDMPLYSIYSSKFYLIEALLSFYYYSKKYIHSIYKEHIIPQNFSGTILDVGCGIGLSTVLLQDIFKKSTVIGTNVKGFQFQYCKAIGANVVESYNRKNKAEIIVFASEYFEHFKSPIIELQKILNIFPETLIIANSFNAVAIGHFPTYHENLLLHDIPAKRFGRIFNQYLRYSGYIQQKTNFWNNRPTIWRKNNDTRI